MNRVYKSTKREKPVSPLVSYWRRLDKPLILAALLCWKEGAPEEMVRQVFRAASYHDVGRSL